MEREEREMKRLIFNLAANATSVDLSHFKLITVLSDEAWNKLRLLKILTILKLPPSLLRIERKAFFKCSQLREVNFTSLTSLQSIGGLAFYNCTSMSSDLILPDSLKVCERYAFSGCRSLTKLHLPSSLLRIEFHVFEFCDGLVGTLDLPHLEYLGEFAFHGCRGLIALNIPPSLKSVAVGTFCECRGFTSINLPSSLELIQYDAFSACTGLIGKLDLSDGIHTIGSNAFAHCVGFTGVLRLPSSLLTVQERVFLNCSGFTTLELGSTLLKIGKQSFAGCKGLKGLLKLPQSLRSLGARAFSDCTNLTDEVKFPPFLSSIADDAFLGCTGLTGIREAIQQHFKQYNQWKARGNVLMIISRVNSDYRRDVEGNAGVLLSAASNANFLSDFSPEGQLIYKAVAFVVDGEGKPLGNAICRLIFSYLPAA
jgi:hypothetical protein